MFNEALKTIETTTRSRTKNQYCPQSQKPSCQINEGQRRMNKKIKEKTYISFTIYDLYFFSSRDAATVRKYLPSECLLGLHTSSVPIDHMNTPTTSLLYEHIYDFLVI